MNAVPPQFIKSKAFDLIGSVTGAARRSLLRCLFGAGLAKGIHSLSACGFHLPPLLCALSESYSFLLKRLFEKVNTVNLFM